jgi:hypothetical protein
MDLPGPLVWAQLTGDELLQDIGVGRSGSIDRHHERGDSLTEVRIRHADDRDFPNARML